ncbi:acyltransferase domain-containing protein, partial [Streptomyces diastatochromogenes]|uniref:acyltransferase domain-containing protein n=1 Tax=Streptomyces diastatochromogenes TaxID=42236 RepID=UPI001ABF1210
TPMVDWSSGAVELLTEERAWSRVDRPRRAGVSSFGISGTNAHVIIEEPEQEQPAPDAPDSAGPWLLSAHSREALSAQAERLRAHVAGGTALPADIGHSLAATRTALPERAVLTGSTPEELTAALDALAAGEPSPAVIDGSAAGAGRTAVLFTGQGAQRLGMGRELHAASPVFAAALDEACAALDPYLEHPMHDVLFAADDSPLATLLHATAYTQPALFAVETALFRLAEHHGLMPDLLAGHSIGEVTAAHAAGVLTLPDAARLVAARGRLMQSARAGGAMVAIEAEEAELAPDLEELTGRLALAAVNGPASVVVSGDEDAVTDLAERWRARGRRTRRLQVSHAFHSPHMDDVLDEFHAVAESLTFHVPRIPLVSTVTGEVATVAELTSPGYWAAQIRRPVRFLDAVRTLSRLGATVFVEAGPDPVLTSLTRSALGDDVTAVPLMRAGHPERDTLTGGLARAWAHGAPLDGTTFHPGGRRVDLPTYAFRRSRFWLAPESPSDTRALGLDPAGHPLLHTAVDLAGRDDVLLTGRFSTDTHPWLADHAIGGTVLVPATAFLELALAAAGRTGTDRVDELTLEAPLLLPEHTPVRVQVAVGAPGPSGERSFTVHARPETAAGAPEEWTRHATGVLGAAHAVDGGNAPALPGPWPPAGAAAQDLDGVYDRLGALGYGYGPAFQCLTGLWRAGDDLYAEVALPAEQHAAAERFGLHPALFDALLHPLVLHAADGTAADGIRLPFAWTGTRIHATGATSLRVRITPAGPDTYTLTAVDPTGAPVVSLDALSLRPIPADRLAASAPGRDATPYEVRWTPVPTPAAGESHTAEVTGDDLPEADVLLVRAERLAAAGADELPAAAHRTVTAFLDLLQRFLADPRLDGARLLVVTRGAVATVPGEAVPDLAAAPVLGLARSAESEHPGRIVLLDADTDLPADDPLLAAALATAEPQLALRDGTFSAPRLVRGTTGAAPATAPLGTGAVLVTGGTGGLGALFARHLVEV